jgi:phage baseplate assembly protein gpV
MNLIVTRQTPQPSDPRVKTGEIKSVRAEYVPHKDQKKREAELPDIYREQVVLCIMEEQLLIVFPSLHGSKFQD